MATRSTVTQVCQVGVESTSGTAVAASKLLQSLSFMLAADPTTKQFRPAGLKFPTVSALGKDVCGLKMEGQPTYDEMIYAWSMALTAGVVTTPGGGTTSRDWTITPSTTVPDSPKSLTVEQGSSVRAHRAAYALLTGLTVDFAKGREEISCSGDGFAQALEDGVTLTATPATIPLIPMLAKDTSFYLDATAAGLGGTKVKPIGATFSLSNRFAQKWLYDAAVASYTEHYEVVPTAEWKVTFEADATGMAPLPLLRAGTTRFLRAETVGPIIEGAIPYRQRIDCALQWSQTGEFSDEDGIYAVEWTGTIVHDATYAKAMQVVVTNTRTAL